MGHQQLSEMYGLGPQPLMGGLSMQQHYGKFTHQDQRFMSHQLGVSNPQYYRYKLD